MQLFDNSYFIAGIHNIFPVIIIIGILISKFFEFTSKKTKTSTTSSKNNKPYSSPRDELKKFLETLSETNIGSTDEPRQPPTPPTIQLGQQPNSSSLEHSHIQHKSEHRKSTESWKREKSDREKQHPEIPYSPNEQHKQEPNKHITTVLNTPNEASTRNKKFTWNNSDIKNEQKLVTPEMIGNSLVSRNSLAQAFVMKDILDTPLGLRTD